MIDVKAEAERRMDGADRDYLEAVRAIGEEYERDGREICARFDAVKKECAEKLEAAKSEKWNAARRLNDESRARAAAAARSCMARAEHPEDIEAASAMLDATIGGTCHDRISFNESAAEAAMISVLDRRRQREERERKHGRSGSNGVG